MDVNSHFVTATGMFYGFTPFALRLSLFGLNPTGRLMCAERILDPGNIDTHPLSLA